MAEDVQRIGIRSLTDGSERDAFEDSDGQQFVQSDADERMHGQWLRSADEPNIV